MGRVKTIPNSDQKTEVFFSSPSTVPVWTFHPVFFVLIALIDISFGVLTFQSVVVLWFFHYGRPTAIFRKAALWQNTDYHRDLWNTGILFPVRMANVSDIQLRRLRRSLSAIINVIVFSYNFNRFVLKVISTWLAMLQELCSNLV